VLVLWLYLLGEENVQLEQELAGFNHDRDSLITIGVFDGVHLGHKYLISQLKELANEQGFRSVVITFDKHPQEILTPMSHPLFLVDASEKATLLKKENVDDVIVLTFTKELANYSARDFLVLLKTNLNMRGLVVGPDFALGRNNEGNIRTIKPLASEMNVSVTVIPPVIIDDEIVSSTSIRRALVEGNMEKVQKLMGRPFSLHGPVIHGKGRGTGLGYPTINLDVLPGQALPSDGVYATLAFLDQNVYSSVTNIGKNPTFGNSDRTVETFLLNYHNNLYARNIKVAFVHKIRSEIKFQDIEQLKNQISLDIKQAGIILTDLNNLNIKF
jgi:riboflavin kinase/FMN adenylyltransferase